MSLKEQATTSVIWSAVERFSVQGIQLLLTIIIARVLMPSDYGLIAMLSIFMAIAQTFIDSGFSNALIQKKGRTDTDFSTVFYFNIVVSCIVYILMYLGAPYIADFYNEPKLDTITKILGLVIVINSFGIVQQAKLTIELNFRKQAHASLTAVIISGIISVTMAYSGFGVWALVWQSIIYNVIRIVLMWYYAKWKPLLVFSKKSFKTLFSFGSKLLGSSILHTIYVNLYTLIIGKFFAADICGLYNQAYKLSTFPSNNIASIIVRAVYPIQCSIQNEDEQFRDLFLKYIRMSCYFIFPIMVLLCVLAKPFVIVFLKDQWLPAVPLLQILCLAYMWDPVMKINGSTLTAKGHSKYFFHAEIYKKVVAFIILLVTIPFGITIMCWGLVMYAFSDMFIISLYIRKVINIRPSDQLKTIFPVILLSASMGIIVYILNRFIQSDVLQLVAGGATGVLYYIIISYFFKFKEALFFKNMIKQYKK